VVKEIAFLEEAPSYADGSVATCRTSTVGKAAVDRTRLWSQLYYWTYPASSIIRKFLKKESIPGLLQQRWRH